MSDQPAHVVIVGGGPAGSATAIELRRRHLDVTLVERSAFDRFRIGETLPPSAYRLLDRLGVWNDFLNDGHRPSPGIVSLWESAVPYENDFAWNPFGDGWHLDRRRFDVLLLRAAEASGARVLRQTRLRGLHRRSAGGFQIEVEGDSGPIRLAADSVVDATGRASRVARQLGASRYHIDGLVAIVGTGCDPRLGEDRTFVEASRGGWWYGASLPADKAVVAYFTEASSIRAAGRRPLLQWWRNELSSTSLVGKVFARAVCETQLSVAPASTVCLDSLSGDGWLAVGDAALSLDPLSSMGIMQALQSALNAGEAITLWLSGAARALDDYNAMRREFFEQYLAARAEYYRQVDRWPDSPFWSTRAELPPAGAHPSFFG